MKSKILALLGICMLITNLAYSMQPQRGRGYPIGLRNQPPWAARNAQAYNVGLTAYAEQLNASVRDVIQHYRERAQVDQVNGPMIEQMLKKAEDLKRSLKIANAARQQQRGIAHLGAQVTEAERIGLYGVNNRRLIGGALDIHRELTDLEREVDANIPLSRRFTNFMNQEDTNMPAVQVPPPTRTSPFGSLDD